MTQLFHPVSSDIKKVFTFMEACDVAEFGEPDSSWEDLEEQWSELDLDQDAWIGVEDEKVTGYACIYRIAGRFFLDLYTHSSLSPDGLAEQLISAAIQRAEILQSADSGQDSCIMVSYSSARNHALLELLEGYGFSPVTYVYRMQIDFDGLFPEPIWPEEYTIRAYQDSDEMELYNLIESTFTWKGRVSTPIDEWRSHVLRGGRFNPELFIMVRIAGKLVGAALSYDEGVQGWVKQLAVSKDMQGKGLGSLLLKHVMSVYNKRGAKSVALAVSSENKNACQFYERCGMRRTREFVELHRMIGKLDSAK